MTKTYPDFVQLLVDSSPGSGAVYEVIKSELEPSFVDKTDTVEYLRDGPLKLALLPLNPDFLGGLNARTVPHLMHFVRSVGLINVHFSQCHCNTEAIEPIFF